ncbi:MAG TPA: hypothetical protein VG167_18830 [Verrucomicrobiae bacterium]|nr:hypothetical protein [Verrucomicrobiae bacterium]
MKAFLSLLLVACLILVGGWFFGWVNTNRSSSKQEPVAASLSTESEKSQGQRGSPPQTEKWWFHMSAAGTNLHHTSPRTAEVDQYGDPITARLPATNTGGTGPGWRLLNGYTPATNNWTSFNLAGTNETNETWFGNAFKGANQR